MRTISHWNCEHHQRNDVKLDVKHMKFMCMHFDVSGKRCVQMQQRSSREGR